MSKHISTRIITKHGTEAEWAQSSFIPFKGEIIVYDADSDHPIPRFKIGDGSAMVKNLPFIVTKEQIGLENVDNTADADKSVKHATTADSATRLATARNINVSGGIAGTAKAFDGTKNISIPVKEIYDGYTVWGGKNVAGNISAIDGAASNLHSANRFAFARPDGVIIEYSRDNGTTWNTYTEATDDIKTTLISNINLGTNLYVGGNESLESVTVNDKLRITFNANDMFVYIRLQKLLINISTEGATGCYVDVEKALNSDTTTFIEVGSYSIGGWSGWNSIPMGFVFGGAGANNSGILRLTFRIGSIGASGTSRLRIMGIYAIGDTYWSTPSTMARNGHLYDYDVDKNATFPAGVSAKSFIGNLTGKATGAYTTDIITSKGTGDAYIATVPGITSLVNGVSFIMKAHASIPVEMGAGAKFADAVVANPTLNVNNLGAKEIKVFDELNADTTYSYKNYDNTFIHAGDVVLLVYENNYWNVKSFFNLADLQTPGLVRTWDGWSSETPEAPACYDAVQDNSVVPTQSIFVSKIKELDETKEAIEYDSNENGEYYKFQNGTLICTKRVDTPITFAATGSSSTSGIRSGYLNLGQWAYSFLERPRVSITASDYTAGGVPYTWLGKLESPNMSTKPSTTYIGKADFYTAFSSLGTSVTIPIDVIGIGRWK